jgi:hypothetical protein
LIISSTRTCGGVGQIAARQGRPDNGIGRGVHINREGGHGFFDRDLHRVRGVVGVFLGIFDRRKQGVGDGFRCRGRKVGQRRLGFDSGPFAHHGTCVIFGKNGAVHDKARRGFATGFGCGGDLGFGGGRLGLGHLIDYEFGIENRLIVA